MILKIKTTLLLFACIFPFFYLFAERTLSPEEKTEHIKALQFGSAEKIITAIHALGELNFKEQIPHLIKLLGHPEESVVVAAGFSLAGMSGEKIIIEAFRNYYTKNPYKIKALDIAVIEYLGNAGDKQSFSILFKDIYELYLFSLKAGSLKENYDNKSLEIKEAYQKKEQELEPYLPFLCKALIQLKEVQALPVILRFFDLNHGDEELIKTLKTTSNQGWAIRSLIQGLKTDERGIAEFCMDVLNQIELKEPERQEVLKIYSEKLFKNDENNAEKINYKELRRLAAQGLGLLGDENSVGLLIKALEEDDSQEVRGEAALGLSKLGGKNVIPHLKNAIKDQSDYVRGCAVYAYGRVAKGQKVKIDIDLIKYRFENDTSATVKLFSAAILNETGEDKDGSYKKYIEETAKNSGVEKEKELAEKLLKRLK